MCVIFRQLPGYTLPYDKLFNAVHNNSHGYGIIVKADNKVELHKELPKDGNDPEKIYKILKANEDAERWVHVRNKTQGDVVEDNTQPFEVYNSKHQRIFFMHNGTLPTSDITPSNRIKEANPDFSTEVNAETASDSRKFAFWMLQPFLLRLQGEKGPADLTDVYVQEMLQKFWPTHTNKGVLVSSLNNTYLLLNPGQWKTIKDGDDKSFIASNDDYFDKLVRGPLYDKQKAEEAEARRAAMAERTAAVGSSSRPLSNGVVELISPPFSKRFGLSATVEDIFEDYDLYTEEGMLALCALTHSEISKLFKDHQEDAIMLFMQIGSMLADTANRVKNLVDDKEKAQKLIESLKNGTKIVAEREGDTSGSEEAEEVREAANG